MCEIKGKIILINDEEQVSASFVKRSFVVETQDQYPQSIILELHQDKCDLVDPYKVGEEVTCSINIRGKAYTPPMGETKYFNTLTCWKIQRG